MKTLLVVVMALSLVLTPMLALADDGSLRVQGNAQISIAPDTAILSVGYATEDVDSTEAQRQATEAIEAVVAALKEMGIAEEDIVTAYLNTYPAYDYTEAGQNLRGYRVEHMLSVTVRELDQAGAVLDAALQAGANTANSVTYASSKEKETYLEALGLAVDDATAKAERLSMATGAWLGKLLEVNEVNGYSAPMYSAKTESDVAGGSIGSTLMSGNLNVTASVELVFEIK